MTLLVDADVFAMASEPLAAMDERMLALVTEAAAHYDIAEWEGVHIRRRALGWMAAWRLAGNRVLVWASNPLLRLAVARTRIPVTTERALSDALAVTGSGTYLVTTRDRFPTSGASRADVFTVAPFGLDGQARMRVEARIKRKAFP